MMHHQIVIRLFNVTYCLLEEVFASWLLYSYKAVKSKLMTGKTNGRLLRRILNASNISKICDTTFLSSRHWSLINLLTYYCSPACRLQTTAVRLFFGCTVPDSIWQPKSEIDYLFQAKRYQRITTATLVETWILSCHFDSCRLGCWFLSLPPSPLS